MKKTKHKARASVSDYAVFAALGLLAGMLFGIALFTT